MTRSTRSVAVLAISFAVSGALYMALVSLLGTDADGLRATLRISGRLSFVLFLLPFVASSLLKLSSTRSTRLLMKHRRDFGLAFAGAQFAHLGLILELAMTTDHAFPALVVGFGGFGFVLIAAMAITSFDRIAKAVGKRAWSRLHTGGVYFLSLIFAYDFYGGFVRDPVLYAPFAIALTAAYAVRVAARRAVRIRRAERA